jgi:hypothetical protein
MVGTQREKQKDRKEARQKLEKKWKASMAGKPLPASPEPRKVEPKPEPPPPLAQPATNKDRIKELMGRNKK